MLFCGLWFFITWRFTFRLLDPVGSGDGEPLTKALGDLVVTGLISSVVARTIGSLVVVIPSTAASVPLLRSLYTIEHCCLLCRTAARTSTIVEFYLCPKCLVHLIVYK